MIQNARVLVNHFGSVEFCLIKKLRNLLICIFDYLSSDYQMKVLFVISAIVSIASAGVGPIVIIPSTSALIRSPQRDSAIIQSERLGGNFAYAIAEGQSFQTVSPILTSVRFEFRIFFWIRSDFLCILCFCRIFVQSIIWVFHMHTIHSQF